MGILLSLLIVTLIVTGTILMLHWKYLSPRDLTIERSLNLETWTAVPPDTHHAFTDLTKYRGNYLLAHVTSPWHFASTKSRLVIRSSPDARQWKILAETRIPGEDVRDPKLTIIHDRLFIYFLRNKTFDPRPFQTSFCVSDDASAWSEPRDLSIKGWLLGRPKTTDGITFYAPAWQGYRRSMLFKSTNGIDWIEVTPLYPGDRSDETEICVIPNGSMVMIARGGVNANMWGYDPDGYTLIGTSSPPYMDWRLARSYETRLDGPCLFRIGERTYACGRRHVGGARYMGSAWGKKRTALYLVLADRLLFLFDLPSCGDTSYAGAIVDGYNVLLSYYTSPPKKDYRWLMGMLLKSSIEMARFKIEDIEKLANDKLGSGQRCHDGQGKGVLAV